MIEKNMQNNITNFTLNPLVDAKFIQTFYATYEQNNIKKSWEVVQAHDSVAILLYHKEKESFILVKQFRPAVYVNNQKGMSVELCAGIVDKELTLQQIAQEEIEEECGYAVPLEKIKKITSFYTSVGFAGSKQMLYYAEVSEKMKVSDGGGVDGELIETVMLPIQEAKKFIFDEDIVKTPGLMFAFMWWFDKIRN